MKESLTPCTKIRLTFKAYLGSINEKTKHKLRIICADDIFLNLEALRIAFVNIGLEEYCKFVRNGQEVVEACQAEVGSLKHNEGLTQIVITDYQMPFMTGVEAITEIRAFYNIQNARIRQVKTSMVNDSDNIRLKELTMPTFLMFSVHNSRIF